MTCARPAKPKGFARRTSIIAAAAVAWVFVTVGGVRAEAALVSLEADGAMPLGTPQSNLFGPGGGLAFGVLYPIAPQLLVGGRLRVAALLDGDPPVDPGRVDPDMGTLEVAELALRLRPFASEDEASRATGLFVDGAFGGGLTGEETRMVLEAGLGFGVDLGGIGLAPVVRYLQVVQPDDQLSDADARLLLAGIEFSFGGKRAKPAPKGPPPPREKPDRDGDGIEDLEDSCPDDPEDHDGFVDEDGCPDPDNDADGLADMDDDCPDEAEDPDGFADDDGCPDPDNDQDSFLDGEDECPNEAEVVNGNKDYDGCPDEGLIEFKDDRIVLEERVLFDLERARIKRAGRPVLKAIVELQKQHPEWISIRIEGHADARGDEDYNLRLSKRRADKVRDGLVRLGIPADLITSEGYGSTRLRDKRDDPEAHQRNRRVEFVVVARKTEAPPAGDAEGDERDTEAGPDPVEQAGGDSEAQAGSGQATAGDSSAAPRGDEGGEGDEGQTVQAPAPDQTTGDADESASSEDTGPPDPEAEGEGTASQREQEAQ